MYFDSHYSYDFYEDGTIEILLNKHEYSIGSYEINGNSFSIYCDKFEFTKNFEFNEDGNMVILYKTGEDGYIYMKMLQKSIDI